MIFYQINVKAPYSEKKEIQNKERRKIITNNHSQENVIIVKFSKAGSFVTILFLIIN